MRSPFSVLQVLATVLAFVDAQKGLFGGAPSTGGTGKYKASYSVDPSLKRHTIYAPKSPPPGVKLPLITWGNSACAGDGVGFAQFLTELASHGYVIIVSGQGTSFTPKTTDKDMSDSINWAVKNPAAAKYSIDTSRIGTAGQSCGGIQALHVGAEDSRVKLITLFNSGSLNAKDSAMARKVAVPIGYFLGGTSDIAYNNGQKDYNNNLSPKIPALLATINTGHMGTYQKTNGGTSGKAAVAWFNWQFKNDSNSKALLMSPGSALTKDGWSVKHRNF